ncbi:response regulator [Pseudarthrobacter sp. fls2-241-R2A-127]|uniref:PAS domain-containing hybrid sensor histidine kinase/response regulator n=1 Tax=Pseudarthrobacter sp. fls2-241-R2A-127 TaxID=3040303 RepID=UPI0025545F75|nr:response regulator [Pseudarthrobacter sp. fls2-241-R2A-127]
MSQNDLLESRRPIGGRMARLAWLVGFTALVLAALALYFVWNNGTEPARVTGDFFILAAALVAGISCSGAARRGENARAWSLLAAAAFTWAAGQAIWTLFGLTNNNTYPFPSIADVLFLAYSVPAAAALFSFKRPAGATRAGWVRSALDASVIAGSVLAISWYTALGPALSSSGDVLTVLVSVAYPVVDVVMTSLVLVLAMRRQPGERLPWLCFGSGLLALTITDSTYVRLTFDGVTGVTGSPLALGWIGAFLLIALAPLVPYAERPQPERKAFALALELLPYAPILVALAVVAGPHVQELNTFLLVVARTTVVLIVIRQVLIVIQNLTLATGLEREVAVRTAELEGLGAIVNSSTDAILSTTPEGVIASWNPGAERQYGYSAEEAIGRDGRILLPPGSADRIQEIFERLRGSGEAMSFETEHVRKDGTVIPVSATVSPIRKDGNLRGIAIIARDITLRRAAENELKAARAAALEASRLKSEFLATMSHEIRTPMNGVVGLTALLLETPLDETQKQYAQGVQGAGEALLALINDILDFSKLEAGKVELDLRPFDPRLLVEDVAGLLAEPAQAKGLELIAYCEPGLPGRLTGDSGRIRQILLNLASNAVKFTAAGEVAIRITAETRDRRPGAVAMIYFEVRDTGIGIEPAQHARLFESFSQADASTTRRYGGTGLGLAICSRLTEAMSGEIGMRSVPGQGSTFWFRIPLPVAPPSTNPLPAADFLTGMRVLVVDDNATNRLVLESQLRGWRLKPHPVPDAMTALASAREAAERGEPYDLAVLDLCMPGTNGLELAQAIKADPALAGIELIMLTSTMQINGSAIADAGVREWLMKPVRSSEFYNRLVRLMSTSGQRPPAQRLAGMTSAALREQAASGPSHHRHVRGRLLVVEDNDVNQLVARSTVAKFGYAVDVVANGAEAVAAVETTPYDAVLMDCHMPVMDGFEATRIIRSRENGSSRLPIIAMTAGALDGDRERCLTAGMDDYLAKPVDATDLEMILARWVRDPATRFLPGQPLAVTGGHGAASSGHSRRGLDMSRLAILRDLGPSDGRGLLPAAAEAFRNDVPDRIAALNRAINDNDGPALAQAAHALKGASANIGAITAADLCGELEAMGSNGNHGHARQLVSRLEEELAHVNIELDRALDGAP